MKLAKVALQFILLFCVFQHILCTPDELVAIPQVRHTAPANVAPSHSPSQNESPNPSIATDHLVSQIPQPHVDDGTVAVANSAVTAPPVSEPPVQEVEHVNADLPDLSSGDFDSENVLQNQRADEASDDAESKQKSEDAEDTDDTAGLPAESQRIDDKIPNAVPKAPLNEDVPIDQVFVPLKEWKQKKLEDLESHIRKTEALQPADAAKRRRRRRRRRPLRRVLISDGSSNGLCMPMRLQFLSLPDRRWRQDICPVMRGAQSSSRAPAEGDGTIIDGVAKTDASEHNNKTEYPATEDSDLSVSTQKGGDPNSASVHGQEQDIQVMEHTPSSESDVSIVDGGAENTGETRSSEPRLPKVDKVAQMEKEDSSDLPKDQEVLGQVVAPSSTHEEVERESIQGTVVSALGSRLNPIVGEIVKTIRDASNVLSYSPLAGVKDALLKDSVLINQSSSAASPQPSNVEISIPQGPVKGSSETSPELPSNLENESERQRSKETGKNDISGQLTTGTSEARDIDNANSQSSFGGVKGKPFNFASADAGARVLSVSNGVVGAKNVITGSIDKYMLAPCAGEGIGGSRWIDLELTEEVILESFETGNFEYYSSSARRVAALGASSYPPEQWSILGIFDFADVRTLQRFKLERKGVTRYLRVMFAGKQGHEYYCPISTIRAFGKNLLTDWKDALDRPKDEYKNAQSKGTKSNGGKAVGNGAKKSFEKVQTGTTPKQVDPTNAEGRGGSDGERGDKGCSEGSCTAVDAHRPPTADSQERDATADRKFRDDVPEDGHNDLSSAQHKSADSPSRPEGKSPADAAADSNSIEEEQLEDDVGTKLGTNTNRDDSSYDDRPAGAANDNEIPQDTISEDDQLLLETMRAETLSAISENDNIFRKVTRMIRLLELNQSLTNQYIDTHLSRFASALSNTRQEASTGTQAAIVAQAGVARLRDELEEGVRRIEAAALRRDVLLCVLTILVSFLVGVHWVLWGAVAGGRVLGERHEVVSELHAVSHDMSASELSGILSDGTTEEGDRLPSTASVPAGVDKEVGNEWTSADGRRRKKKVQRRVSLGDDVISAFTRGGGGGRRGGKARGKVRSQSSTELLAASRGAGVGRLHGRIKGTAAGGSGTLSSANAFQVLDDL